MKTAEDKRATAKRTRQLGRLLGHGITLAPAKFKALAKLEIATTFGATAYKLSNAAAIQALGATHTALFKLATKYPGRAANYKPLMDKVLHELLALKQQALDAENYQPITDAFKGAKNELKSAYNDAKTAISGMKDAAAILAAFASLISAI
ncbi:hypothetical protein [Mesorhizobium amorphae]|uniref:hypothetical protein n=1 Tax=Mesorhizobium amorphae TaxID=71433 RepID=UPI001182BC0F|nr:hypothetical protein [Mesorhizobium amorphae]